MQWPEMIVLITDLQKCGKIENITASPSTFFTGNSGGLRREYVDLITERRFNSFIDTRNFPRNTKSFETHLGLIPERRSEDFRGAFPSAGR